MTDATREVDTIVTARWVVPVVPAGLVLDHHSVVMDGGRIVELLPTASALRQYRARELVHCEDHVLTPGFINAHGHAAMTLFRGLADDKPLHAWLEQDIWPAESRWVSEQFVGDGTRLALLEMLLGGTTCFGDMYFFPDVVAQEAVRAGMRAQLAFPVLEFPTAWAANADEYLAKGTALYDQYRGSELIRVAFGLHAIYTVSEATLAKAATMIAELDATSQMHVHETLQEVHNALAVNGERPLRTLHRLGLLTPSMQCVHASCVNDEDIALLAAGGSHVIHCPNSNLKLASGLCPVARLADIGINVALGTDGAASNNSLDMGLEMATAARLAKCSGQNATALPAAAALAMATINGARALGMEDRIGSLEVGKLADIVAHDLSGVRSQPVYNPLSQLVYTTDSSRVRHVWVGGEQLVRDGKPTRLSVADVVRDAALWRERIKP